MPPQVPLGPPQVPLLVLLVPLLVLPVPLLVLPVPLLVAPLAVLPVVLVGSEGLQGVSVEWQGELPVALAGWVESAPGWAA